jgi:DNA-binding winged helix-turn-helix (wHTH) protein
MSGARRYRFGDFELDTATERLVRGDVEVALAPQPFALLRLLLENHDTLVTREQATRYLWSDRQVEYEQGLNFCIRQIRAALDDAADTPEYVQTVPRRGYRFLASVEEIGAPPATATLPRWFAAAAAGAVLLGIFAVWWAQQPRSRAAAQIVLEPIQVLGLDTGNFVAAAILERLRDDLEEVPGIEIVDHLDAEYSGYRLTIRTILAAEGAEVRIDLQLQEAERPTPMWSASARAATEDLLPLEQDLRRDLLVSLNRLLAGDAIEGEEAIERERKLPASDETG